MKFVNETGKKVIVDFDEMTPFREYKFDILVSEGEYCARSRPTDVLEIGEGPEVKTYEYDLLIGGEKCEVPITDQTRARPKIIVNPSSE